MISTACLAEQQVRLAVPVPIQREALELLHLRSVRFASEVSERRDIDISRWPGVYVHPGEFKPPTANVEDEGEAWIRFRDRYRRLQAHRHLPKAERRKRQREILVVSDGHSTTHKTSTSGRPAQTDGASVNETIKLKIDEALRAAKSEDKREAILHWLIVKLAVLLEKISGGDECAVTTY
ncbi:uncharacterized protein M421DRAFT_3408 [Didymella exigua CBS 183.55]|uniref:Uncharacterized protein n=1 Tax=Didymella exigua CBS 183.55 TaxID=1150837 RepID=A0A6A5RRD2_9PLEO|nr:uncharacterized protein M421DRAFT_3408 [Didymella exigua CBS 183.55]KAF1930332.1 hypothetical protein M421DRAFT_3408 [Didymella exigua CBS 183.55]